MDYKRELVPPHLGHLGLIFSALWGNLEDILLLLSSFMQEEEEEQGKKGVLGMVFQGVFYRISSLIYLAYLHDVEV